MTITLTPHQEQAIRSAIRAGLVSSVDEFIETAIEALPHRDTRGESGFDPEKARRAGERIRELRPGVRWPISDISIEIGIRSGRVRLHPSCPRANAQRMTPDRAHDFVAQLASLNLRADSSPVVADVPRLRALAQRHGLTAYDTACLDLANRLALPLATRDGALTKAAIAEGIELPGA